MLFTSIIALLSAGLVAAAPTNTTYAAGLPTVIVKNQCKSALKVGHSIDTEYFGDVVNVPAGKSYTLTLPINWTGRVWGRESCSGNNCFKSGMGSPASLAEFFFKENGDVFYDISFVDGFNLPMVIEPVNKVALKYGDERLCATSSCSVLPNCPTQFITYDDQGNVSGCKSACTYYNTDEYCCTGDYHDPNVCKTYSYASDVKAACPDVYSYAFDDFSSAFMCTSHAYTVTFC